MSEEEVTDAECFTELCPINICVLQKTNYIMLSVKDAHYDYMDEEKVQYYLMLMPGIRDIWLVLDYLWKD